MTRQRMRVGMLLGVLGAFLAMAGAAYLIPRRDAVTVASVFERLTVGMTEAEVDAAVPISPGERLSRALSNR